MDDKFTVRPMRIFSTKVIDIRHHMRGPYYGNGTDKEPSSTSLRDLFKEHLGSSGVIAGYEVYVTDFTKSGGRLTIEEVVEGAEAVLGQFDVELAIKQWQMRTVPTYAYRGRVARGDHEFTYTTTGAPHVSLMTPPEILIRAQLRTPVGE